MKRWQAAALGVAWAAWAVFGLATIITVPFHPDEATHIYLSADFDRLVRDLDPAGVAWQAAGAPEHVRRYRLLEAPLSRYLIGLSRSLMGIGDQRLTVDWDWSASWAVNEAAGAVPDARLLAAARLPAALLTVLAPLLLFDLGRRMTNDMGGATAAIIYAVSGTALLHGRRAMSEGPLLFFGLLAAWVAVRTFQAKDQLSGPVHRWMVPAVVLGAAVALAAAAKLTGWLLLPVAVVVVMAAPAQGPRPRVCRLSALLASAILLSWVLNPALWAAPIPGLRAMGAARTQLLAEQVATIRAAGAGHVLDGPDERVLAELYHTYLAPLAFWDIPNYAAQTAAAERAYQANLLQAGMRPAAAVPRQIVGSVFLALGLAGAAFAALRWRHTAPGSAGRHSVWLALLLAVWTAATIAGLFAFDIAWQRYYVPLLPVACLWAGCAVGSVADSVVSSLRRS